MANGELKIAGKKITTIVSDLDGTLLHRGEQSLQHNLPSYIETLLNSGIRFIAASGRMASNISKIFEDMSDRIYIIADNGSSAFDKDGTCLRCITMDRALSKELLDDFKNEPLGEFIASNMEVSYSVPKWEGFIDRMVNLVGCNAVAVDDMDSLDVDYIKISIWYRNGIPEGKSEYFHEKYAGRLSVTESGNGWIDFMPLDGNKGAALIDLSNQLGFSLDETLAFGDSENDISLMEAAGLSICMKHGEPATIAAADATAPSVEAILEKCVIQLAMNSLHDFVISLSEKTDKGTEYGENLWNMLIKSEGVLKELSYYHDNGEFWNKHQVAGYTLSDIIVWQVDHFKAYMDRHDDMNRYKKERLLLESLEVMLRMESDPEPYIRKMQEESGTDSDQRKFF